MTFADHLLWEEILDAAESIGLSDQVVAFVRQSFASNPGFSRRRTDDGGVLFALNCELALLRGAGIIDAENRYNGPIPGICGPEYAEDGRLRGPAS